MESCLTMRVQSVYAWMLAAALICFQVETIPCAAQPPVPPSPVQPPPVPPTANGREGQGFGNLPQALPPPLSSMPERSVPAATAPSPLSGNLNLKAAPFESTDVRFPINLATALRLSDARPLIVAAAQAGVWVAEAELTRAKVLWLPAPMFGVDYVRHDGGGPDFNKGIMTAPSVNYFQAGGGLDLSY